MQSTSVKLKSLNIFDLLQNSKTLYYILSKNSGTFSDYPFEATRLYFNLMQSGLTISEFADKTKIPKTILGFLKAMKKPDGSHWSDLHLKIIQTNEFIDKNVSYLNNAISILENCPISAGYRKYDIDTIKVFFNTIPNYDLLDILNIVGFDIAQYNNCKKMLDTEITVQKDVKKARKIKEKKAIISFKNHPVVLEIKINQLDLTKTPNKLKIVESYRKLVADVNIHSYGFKQFCEDCELKDQFKSLNYYYLNFDKVKEKTEKPKSQKVKTENKKSNLELENSKLKETIDQLTTEKLSVEGLNKDLEAKIELLNQDLKRLHDMYKFQEEKIVSIKALILRLKEVSDKE